MHYLDALDYAIAVLTTHAEEPGDWYEKQGEEELVDTLRQFARDSRSFARGTMSHEAFLSRLHGAAPKS